VGGNQLSQSLNVALVKWNVNDELSQVIADELSRLGHRPQNFLHNTELPREADIVLTFAPYGKLLPIARRVAKHPRAPLLAHWNFEGFPDSRLPWTLVYGLSMLRSRLDGVRWLDQKMKRYQYLGDYFYAYRRGWLKVFAIISKLHERHYNEHGLPAHFVPWGTSPRFFRTLQLERDIDVLWFGKRRTSHRSTLIDEVCNQVRARGYTMMIADNVKHPFIYGDTRTQVLNRAKIVLNVKATTQSSGFAFRFHMVAGNRALVVAEDFPLSVPNYRAGVHFASAPPEQLAETVIYYLEHEDERRALAENAYQFATNEMTLKNSVHTLMQHIEQVRTSI
jgi:hypothetical protein